MLWSETPIYFIDFEGNLTSGILEYGIVTLLGGQIVAAETRVCGAAGHIRPADIAIHGLNESQLSGHPPFAADFDMFASKREAGPFAAHFAHAENTLIKATWPYPRTSPDFARPGARITDWGPWIDTGRIYSQLFPRLESAKLEDLIASSGLGARLAQLAETYCPASRRMYHAALYDALAGALLLLAVGERSEFEHMTLPWLLQLSTLNPEKRASLQQRDLFEGI